MKRPARAKHPLFPSSPLFAYGTLEVPAVLRAVAGRAYPGIPALLRGYARFLVRGEVYPGLVESPGSQTSGVLYLSIDPQALARIDRFEGDLYERHAVRVLDAAQIAHDAIAYVIRPGLRQRLSTQAWDRDRFVQLHLPRFLGGRGDPGPQEPESACYPPAPRSSWREEAPD